MRRPLINKTNAAEKQNTYNLIGGLICCWIVCVLIFIVRNPPGSNSKLTNKLVQVESTPNNPAALSYFETISPELTNDGWKNIYIHCWSARMPVEEMDFLLNKYWYPRAKTVAEKDKSEPALSKSSSASDNADASGHQMVDNIGEINARRSKSRMMIDPKDDDASKSDSKQDHQERLHQAPSIKTASESSSSALSYPSDWSSPCYPDHSNSYMCISEHMQYWKKGVTAVQSTPVVSGKYVTFLKDCGGWNNIRQSFEYHAMVAWVTQRTLVLPPDTAWYLIDYGSITRGRTNEKDVYKKGAWPSNRKRPYGVSNFDIWFDLDDLNKVVPVITTSEFIRRESMSLQIPSEYSGDVVDVDKYKAKEYTKWLNNKASELNVNLPWGQLENVLYWPSYNDVQSKNGLMINDAWVDHREQREYTSFQAAALFIHFPSCNKGTPGDDHSYRYLGNIARSVAFDSAEKDKQFKQIVRDHLHLNEEIINYAAIVVSILGAFNYASFHIRRNELQYKYVFAKAADSFQNVRPLIGDTETLYISTDEDKEDFFKVFEENGKRKVYRWKDFFGESAQFEQTKNVVIPGKLHGEVEMAICAMGRIFFGTKESTFSEYIGRLRGYMNAPYTQTLYHHYPLTKDIDESSKISLSNPGKPYRGQIYKVPFPDLWEDIKDMP